MRFKSLVSILPLLLTVGAVLALLFVPGARADINTTVGTDETSYLLGQMITFSGSVELTEGETQGITSVRLLVVQTEGPGPVFFESFTVDLPLEEGFHDSSEFPDVPGSLYVLVTTQNITTTVGYAYNYFYLGPQATPGRIDITAFWDPPIFLDPGPVFTLIPSTESLFALQDPPAPDAPPSGAPVELPDATTQFSIPIVPIEGLPAGAPDPLPSTVEAFGVPFLATSVPDASPLPSTDTAFAIPLGETVVVGAPTALPGTDRLFDIPSGEAAGAAEELPAITKLFDIPFTGEVIIGTQLPSTDTAFGVPLPPTAQPIAGVPELPETELLFDVFDSVLGVLRTPRGVTLDDQATSDTADDVFYVLTDGVLDGSDGILKFDVDGVLDTSWAVAGEAFIADPGLQETLREAEAITLINDGTTDLLLVAENTFSNDDDANNRIMKFEASSGAFLGTLFNLDRHITGMHTDTSTVPVSFYMVTEDTFPDVFHRDLNNSSVSPDTFLGFIGASPGGLSLFEVDMFTAESSFIQRRDKASQGTEIGSALNPDTVVGISGLAQDGVGAMYIADLNAQAIFKSQFFQAETVTQNPLGLAYDSVEDELYILIEGDPRHKIVMVDPNDASDPPTIIRSFNAPDDTGVGITFLDGHLYYAHNPGSFDRRFKKLDPTDGSVIEDIFPASAFDDLRAISNDGTNLLFTRQFTRDIPVVEPDGTEVGTIFPGDDGLDAADGLAVKSDGLVYQGEGTDVVELEVDGTVLREFELPSFDIEALTFVNGVLFIGNDTDNTIRKAAVPSGRTTDPIDIATSVGSDVVWVLTDATPLDVIIKMVDDGTDTDVDGDGSVWDLDDVLEAPTAVTQGITFLNGLLYVASRDFDAADIFEVDPATGAVLDDFEPERDGCCEIFDNISALANDGLNLVVAIEIEERLFLVDPANGDSEGSIDPPFNSDAFRGPVGLALKSDGQILEAEGDNVIQLAPDGSDIEEFDLTIIDIQGLAIPDGIVYIADDDTDAVYTSDIPSGLTSDPIDMAYDGTDLWVLVNGAIFDRVLQIDPGTGLLTGGEQFNAPNNAGGGLTFLNGFLYYASRLSGQPLEIFELDPVDGAVLDSFDAEQQCCAQTFTDPTSLDNDGTDLVLALNNNRDLFVVEAADGDFVDRIPTVCCPPNDGVEGAEALAINSEGLIFQGDGDEVLWLDPQLSEIDTLDTSLVDIQGLVSTDGVLFLADDSDNSIHEASVPSGRTNDPLDLAIDTTNDVLLVLVEGLVSDRVLRVDLSAGNEGDLLGQFDTPNNDGGGITFLGTSLFYASSPAQLFELDPVDGTVLSGPFDLERDFGLVFDDVLALDNDGTFIFHSLRGDSTITSVQTDGDFEENRCCGAIGPDGLAFNITDAQFFQAKDAKISQTNDGLSEIARFTTSLNEITGLVFNGDVLFIADDDTDTIEKATAPTDITTNPLDLAYSTESDDDVVWVLIEAAPKHKIAKMVNDGVDDDADGNVWDKDDSFDAPDADGTAITFLGTSLFYATRASGEPSEIIELDPADGTVLDSFFPEQQCCDDIFDDITSMDNDGEFLVFGLSGRRELTLVDPASGGAFEDNIFPGCCPDVGFNGPDSLAVELDGSGDVAFFYEAQDEEIVRFVGFSPDSDEFTTDREEISGLVFGGLLLYVADDANDTVYVTRPPAPITTSPLGLTTDGTDLYVLVEAIPEDHILKVDRSTGALLDDFPSGTADGEGITLLEGSLWVASGFEDGFCCGTASVFEINPATGDPVGDFSVEPGFIDPGGIGNDGEFLFIGDRSFDEFTVMDTGGSKEFERFIDDSGGARGLAFSEVEGAFFSAENDDIKQFSSDLFDIAETFVNNVVDDIEGMTFVQDSTFGEVLYLASDADDSIHAALLPQAAVLLTTEPKAMATNGTDLWVVLETEPSDRIMRLDRETGNILDNFDAPKGDVAAIDLFDHDGDSTESLFVGVTREVSGGGGADIRPLIFELDTDGNEIQQFELRSFGGEPFPLAVSGLANDGSELLVGFRHRAGAPTGAKLVSLNLDDVVDEKIEIDEETDFIFISGTGLGNEVEAILVALGNLYVAAGTNLVQFDLASETVEAQFALEGNVLDVKGMAYNGTIAYLADDVTDAVRGTIFPENTPETTIAGTFVPTFEATADSTTIIQAGSPFIIARNEDPIAQIDDPRDGFSSSDESITIRGRVNDPSMETVVVGVDLPFTINFEDQVTAGLSDVSVFETSGLGLWHIVTKPDPDVNFPKANSEPSSWYYGIDSAQNFETGSRTTGSLTLQEPVTIGQGGRLRSFHWYETETDPEFDQKKIEVARAETDSEGDFISPTDDDFQTIAQIVDFAPTTPAEISDAADDASSAATDAANAATDAEDAANDAIGAAEAAVDAIAEGPQEAADAAVDAAEAAQDAAQDAQDAQDAAQDAADAAQDAADDTGGAAQDAANAAIDAAEAAQGAADAAQDAADAADAATGEADPVDAANGAADAANDAADAANDAADAANDAADAANDASSIAGVFQWVTIPPAAFTFEIEAGEPRQVPLFIRADLDLSSFIDDNVFVRFLFDSVEVGIDQGEGWYVDDVSIVGAGFQGKTVTLTPIPGGPITEDSVDFFQEFETTFVLAEGNNTAQVRATLPYAPFNFDTDEVSGFLDETPPFVEFDEKPATTNVATQTVTGTIFENNFDEAVLTQETVFGLKTILILKQAPGAEFTFSKVVALTEGPNTFVMTVTDGAELTSSDTLEIDLDVTGPTVDVLDTTYPKGLVSARVGDLLVFQVNATDDIGVDGVSLVFPGEDSELFIPSDDIPEAIRGQFGTTGNFLFPILVPSGTPSGTLAFNAVAADSAGNETTIGLEARIVPTLDAFVLNLMPDANNFSLPLIPERDTDVRLGMDVRDFIGNLHQLTDNSADDVTPSFNSDHTQVAFSRDGDIFTMEANGDFQVSLSSSLSIEEISPVFIQDDTVIAFMSDEEHLGVFVPAGNGGLDGPTEIAFGPDGNLYVSNGIGDSVLRYDGTTGNFIDAFVTAGSGGLDGPIGLVFGADDNLYVSAINSVLRYDGTTGDFIDAFVSAGSGGLNQPFGLVFGPDGNLYVSSFSTDTVLRYDGTTGDFIDEFVSAASGGLDDPTDVVFGPDGNLYVSSVNNDSVLRYDGTTGDFIDAFVSAGSGGLDGPLNLVFGADDNLYVTSANTDSVLRYAGSTGNFIDEFVSAGSGGLDFPAGLVFGFDDNLYVSSLTNDSVLRYDGTTGAFLGEFDLWFMSAADPSVKEMVAINGLGGLTQSARAAPAPSLDGLAITLTVVDTVSAGGGGAGGRIVVLSSLPTLNAAGDDFTGGPATATDLGRGANPVYSPDGTTIAFDLDGDIWTMPADGTDTETDGMNLTGGSVVSGALFDPAWNSDGTRIAFLREVATAIVGGATVVTESQLLAMNEDGSQVLTLSDTDAAIINLSNDPTGYNQLMFASNQDGDLEIFTMEPRNLAATEAVWWYNALETGVSEEERWHVFTPGDGVITDEGGPDDLDDVETGRGYWGVMRNLGATLENEGFEWDLSAPLALGLPQTPQPLKISYFGFFLKPGKAVPPTYAVVGGEGGKWNQIGYHGETPLPVDIWLQTLRDSLGALFQFDNLLEFELADAEGEDPEIKIILGAFRRLLGEDDATPGLAYWGFVLEDGVVVPGGGGTQD